MGKFLFQRTGLAGLTVVEPAVFTDWRGWFCETYNLRDFQAAGLGAIFVQDNGSQSQKGVLRGLHFQRKNPQVKLVRVLRAPVFDVAADVRKGSKTFGKWFGVRLSAENRKQLYVPQGFAHGFLVLSGTAEVAYKCSQFYDPADEGGIIWNDPDLNIAWPHTDGPVILSEKDTRLPDLKILAGGL
jgi:dTDP-4-dehydrorhamnose 3,5-epimerase